MTMQTLPAIVQAAHSGRRHYVGTGGATLCGLALRAMHAEVHDTPGGWCRRCQREVRSG